MSKMKRMLDDMPSEQAAGVIDLYSAELYECHRLLDFAGIPKTGFDEQLSISQRVSHAVGLLLNKRLYAAHPAG